MHKKYINLFYIIAAITLLASLFSCKSNHHVETNAPDIRTIENHFFTMDFTTNSYELSDLEAIFFTTFPHADPTEGDVVYDRQKWQNENIVELKNGDGLYLYLKKRKNDSKFDSFRLTSKSYYNLSEQTPEILFVYKGAFPSSKGIWPAWWLNGSKEDSWTYKKDGVVETDKDLDKLSGIGNYYDTPSSVNATDWPGAGEIDIIETINGDNIIHNTLHTCPQMCDSEWNSDGEIINCANALVNDINHGCSGKPYKVSSPEGTFACLWEKGKIKFFYWTSDMDVRSLGGPLSEKPIPDQWKGDVLKNEVKLMETECECESELHQEWQCENCSSSNTCEFRNMKMIFNATLCGKWAGNEFDDTNNSLNNCREYINSNGQTKIDNQFMKIEYVSVRKL